MPNVGKIVAAAAKAAAKKKAEAATARGLKAAKGPSLAPKGYKPDTAGRKTVTTAGNRGQDPQYSTVGGMYFPGTTRKKAFNTAARDVDAVRRMAAKAGDVTKAAPKNVISRSGKVANTSRLIKKSAKGK
jgi:hypothetical protein